MRLKRLLLIYFFCNVVLNILASEREIIFSVPEVMYDTVYNYLDYIIADDFEIKSIESTTADLKSIFFDTSTQSLYKKDRYIQYSKYKEPNKKKIESIILGAVNFQGLQAEYAVKHYNTVATYDEKNPLLKLIKRSEREIFKSTIAETFDINPLAFKEFVEVRDRAMVKKLTMNSGDEITILLSDSVIDKFNIHHKGYSLSIQYNESSHNIAIHMKDRFLTLFPTIKYYENKYNYAFDLIRTKIPLADVLVRYPLVFKLTQALFLSLIGLSIMILFFRKRLLSS